jgi:hypothetical protein
MTHPAVWKPEQRPRPPVAQYRVELILTGDGIGPDTLDHLITRSLTALGFTARTQEIETLWEERP